MQRVHFRRAATLAGLALMPLIIWGCDKKLRLPSISQQRPVVRLTAAPIDTVGPDGLRSKYVYHYKMDWIGYDPDGRVDHFIYAIDPPGSPGGGARGKLSECAPDSLPANGDTAWCTTRLNEKEIRFNAGLPDSINYTDPRASEIHTFVIKAVDNTGLMSAPVQRSFFAHTQAPQVWIDAPVPNEGLYSFVTPFVTIRWHGEDPDGVFTQKPVRYKFKLFKDTDAIFSSPANRFDQFELVRRDPDSLRRFAAPTFAGWDSSGADTTFATYTNLVPNSRYLFVVVGFDEAGAYSPIFNLNTSMIQMLVTFAANGGPALTIFNEFFNYTYSTGGYSTDPSRYISLEVPARQPVRFNWSAVAANGSRMKQYRWAMDIANLDDKTPRVDERTDFKHWSRWGLGNTTATVGPFFSDTTHLFFVEAEDVNGLKSLGIVSFQVVVPTFNRDLLIVNDTRLFPDTKAFPPVAGHADSLSRPVGSWPTRAELDTFLFARGGVRWRMTPDGTLSGPGIFSGYRYDTIYTAASRTNGVVTLDTLGTYKHVLWFTDSNSATGINTALGRGVLRIMSEAGRANTLAAYVTLGGKVWMAGGTAIQATMLPWNITTNEAELPNGVLKFSVTPLPGKTAELGPGRMVFDQAHWRSDIWSASSDFAFPHKSIRAVGGYPSRVDPGWGLVRSPDYSLLPTKLGKKGVDDTTPPYRSRSSFLGPTFSLEFLTPENILGQLQNVIVEDDVPDPDSTHMVPTLDTLMIVPLVFNGFPTEREDLTEGGRNYRSYPAMTYYHGTDNAPLVLSGFDLWSFNRRDLVQLVDFVFQQIWGLPKEPIAAPAARAAPPASAARVRR